jgi:hypothetical protein
MGRTKPSTCLGLAALLAGAAAFPQTPAPPRVEEILARYVEARGGLARIRALESFRMTGTLAFAGGPPAPFVLEMKRPRLMRTEFRFAGQVGVQAFDGERAWALLPMAGSTTPEFLPDEASREAADQADIEGLLVDPAAKGTKVVYVGVETVAGRDCHKLEATLKSGAVRHVYLDVGTYLEAKSAGKRRAGEEEVVIETLSRDYREVGGLKLPFLIEAGPAGRPERQRITLEKVELDVPLDASRFRRPGPRG